MHVIVISVEDSFTEHRHSQFCYPTATPAPSSDDEPHFLWLPYSDEASSAFQIFSLPLALGHFNWYGYLFWLCGKLNCAFLDMKTDFFFKIKFGKFKFIYSDFFSCSFVPSFWYFFYVSIHWIVMVQIFFSSGYLMLFSILPAWICFYDPCKWFFFLITV